MNPLRIHLQLIGMEILWGASWPWGRVVAQAMPTFVASSLRFFFAIIPLMIWLYAANRFKYAKQLRANQWIGLFVTAFFGVFAYSTFFIWGLKYLPAGQAAVIVATNPVFTTLLAIFLFMWCGFMKSMYVPMWIAIALILIGFIIAVVGYISKDKK